MRHQVLPLPTGRFIIVQANHKGDIAMIGGAPVAYCRAGLNGQLGVYLWQGRELPATLFYQYRDADNCARQLDAAPFNPNRFQWDARTPSNPHGDTRAN